VVSFDEAFEQHLGDVYAFFIYRLGAVHDAEDLTQATFERAFRAWGRFDARRASARTWLLAIAHNLLVDHHRAGRSRQTQPLDGDPGIAASDSPADLGLDPRLAAALATLPDRDREILALRYGADLAGPEIAKLTSLTLANVQQILSRSLRRLREELGEVSN
jgi:RNA polymerase sigma-70 factor (ECF subfamily)